MTDVVDVIYIQSLPRSGSTLLGTLLGCHHEILFIGEITSPMRKGRPLRCRYCGENPCPIWSDEGVIQAITESYHAYSNKNVDAAGELYRVLLSRHPTHKVVVDSSKNLDWTRFHALNGGIRANVVVLYRDLRGVWASIKQSYPEDYFRRLHSLIAAVPNLTRCQSSGMFANVVTVRYESLVSDPASEIASICQFMNVQAAPDPTLFVEQPVHLFSGNPGPVMQAMKRQGRFDSYKPDPLDSPASSFFTPGDNSVTEDLRWMQILDDRDLDFFEEQAGSLNRELGY